MRSAAGKQYILYFLSALIVGMVGLLVFHPLGAQGRTLQQTTGTMTTTPSGTGTVTTTPTGTATAPPLAAYPVPAPYQRVVARVSAGKFSFAPRTITGSVGVRVTWKNSTATRQTITSLTHSWKFNHVLRKGQSVHYTFMQPGTFRYYSSLHPKMKGTIIIQP
ncbi:MAG TPA: cupredoxin domain-containing protein [Chloroflexota bacterium]